MTRRIWPPESDSPTPSSTSSADTSAVGPLAIDQRIVNVLKQVYDPEIPINIVDLGLIYKIDVTPSAMVQGTHDVHIVMTLTTPNCPEAEAIPTRVRQTVMKIADVSSVEVDITWQPPWDRSKMSDDARLLLGLE